MSPYTRRCFTFGPVLAGAVLALGAAPAFAQVKLFTVHGDHGFDELGTDVAAAGDVNADGVPDWIAGAPRDAFGGGVGYARVYSGLDGSVLYTFVGAAPNDFFGDTVGGAGDVDADGFDDVVVSSRYQTVADVSGRARVFSGRDGSVLHTFGGEVDANFLANPVAGVGDLDGDGHDDVLVGEASCDIGAPDGGRVRVYSGANGAILLELYGALAERLGASAAAAGDVDADGVPDFIVGGSPNVSAGVAGHAWVFSGATGSALLTFVGPGMTDEFASSVSGAGDVDADGHADLLVGAPSDGSAALGAGKATVFSGADGSVLYTKVGTAFVRGVGRDVCGAGDRNGDGFDDFLVSEDVSGVGSGTGGATIYSGADGSLLYRLLTHVPNDQFGRSLAMLGDVDGDGGSDYVGGAYSGDLQNPSTGSVYVFSFAPTYTTYCTSTPNSTGVAATIHGSGYGTWSNNDLVLTATNLPTNQFGLVIASETPGQSTLGNGFLCLTPKVWRIAPVLSSGATGTMTAAVNHNVVPWYYLLNPGETWYLQVWYRDLAGGGAGFNLTDGLQVTFVP